MNTKYYLTWEEYMAKHPEIDANDKSMAAKMQGYEEMMLGFILYLCI